MLMLFMSVPLQAIQQAPTPQNSTELQAYLGLLNYYSKFMPNLSIELAPLYKLLQKTTAWQWGTNEDKVLINQSNCFYLHSFWFILIQVENSFCVVTPLPMALAQYLPTTHPMAQNSQLVLYRARSPKLNKTILKSRKRPFHVFLELKDFILTYVDYRSQATA